jgi:hypothetical protein
MVGGRVVIGRLVTVRADPCIASIEWTDVGYPLGGLLSVNSPQSGGLIHQNPCAGRYLAQ